ncbi:MULTISPECIES: hypothetical protein [Citrobacter]|uniref:hypothetical protein n=1 Tax=Citrobacter TaxID=544 RepID=UPI0019019869|nr:MULTISPECIES: hypothetical protein [Citrobacter]MBJ9134419.1 hypothetical protein [Citrobacter farmeri]MDM2738398.1 hypothetical protein [Citrobacter sp. Ct235]
MASNKKNILTSEHREKQRSDRVKASKRIISPEADIIQNELCREGFLSVVEILFRATNDVYEDYLKVAEKFGVNSPEYERAVKHLNDLARTTSPFFVKEKDRKVELDLNVEEEIKAVLAKRALAKKKGDDPDESKPA